ncbi:hypothetical protein PF005_g1709 [Phytophthora fragariae]|nr:hypothetical protein PF009_g3003 [Phytophthora fragariae]KAE9105887.1 hypothetical protein PF010_g12832 [Phytophthora fragariae]KAE9137122.1 hypothetical protein PF007_g1951 [Phytophthora fragariae]KAE9224379.1 hypothetical protein PF004_g12240 [Phytophthora fragariae]KAE9234849.1 hypothetical protein PF005_g1709 [Phytophthora fragariae]
MTDGEEAARLPKRMETEKADVCYPAFRSTTASSCKDSCVRTQCGRQSKVASGPETLPTTRALTRECSGPG